MSWIVSMECVWFCFYYSFCVKMSRANGKDTDESMTTPCKLKKMLKKMQNVSVMVPKFLFACPSFLSLPLLCFSLFLSLLLFACVCTFLQRWLLLWSPNSCYLLTCKRSPDQTHLDSNSVIARLLRQLGTHSASCDESLFLFSLK